MASGWAGDGAVPDQIDSTIDDAVARARHELPRGESNKFCDECGEPIPEARRQAIIQESGYCVKCQQEKDLHNNTFSGYNRRGSKDSQLR
ncbi:DksA/TraR family C4-type zinc finger protein [Klebsiella pneumoniae]|nr:DksA/TraR family C4-type zinc finger protein [Klebsiella pneumoniae]